MGNTRSAARRRISSALSPSAERGTGTPPPVCRRCRDPESPRVPGAGPLRLRAPREARSRHGIEQAGHQRAAGSRSRAEPDATTRVVAGDAAYVVGDAVKPDVVDLRV